MVNVACSAPTSRPVQIGQVLQLREEVSRSQRELQARDQRIASTNATLDMLQKQMVLTDEQRAASAAENAELKVRACARLHGASKRRT